MRKSLGGYAKKSVAAGMGKGHMPPGASRGCAERGCGIFFDTNYTKFP